ncbi:dnaJ homolog subfamily C member 22 [Cimex lectularius]|uniref:DnaJ homolog subfamily C member 22 n=1 Tax=Cimex lectularius TaxID=79782 RepID=A0A8I6TLF1_CIMLE|nr:dnaJ homolog subfamily C member 22 [Cimex lectularius]
MPEKSLFVTYFLWLFFGVFGLHHFYLGRDIQGFLWFSSFGGYLAGWLRDLFYIPSYVKAANHDSDYMSQFSDKVRNSKSPPYSLWRNCGCVFTAYIWGSMIHMAIPKEEFSNPYTDLLYHLVPLGIALGVWSVGNIGHEEGSIKWPLLAAYGFYPLYLYYNEDWSFTLMTMASTYAFEMKSKQWKRKIKPQKNFLRRASVVLLCLSVYFALWTSSIYFNASITDDEDNEIPIREAIHHFFTSPWWNDLSQSLLDIYNYGNTHGWDEILKKVIELLDPLGEQNAFNVLGLSAGANQTEINTTCRRLSVKYHPDKVKDAEEKVKAQEMFYEIQQACELLSSNRKKRGKKNKKSV